MIACLLLPYLAAAIERRFSSALVSRPLLMAEATRVFAVSAEAAACGVVPGMTLNQARALCPQARLIPANPAHYQQILNEILALLADVSPKLESEVDQTATVIYIDCGDVSGKAQLDLAADIQHTFRATVNLSPSVGLAIGKFPAYIAADAIGLSRSLLIAPGEETGFLAPLPVTYLPLDRELARRFQLLGLRTLGQFAGLPAGAVLTQFGNYGQWLHRLAQGRDDRPVLPYPIPRIERLTRPLDDPITDRYILLSLSQIMVKELVQRLEPQRLTARGMHLILHLEDESRWEKQLHLRRPSGDGEQLARVLATLIERVQVRCGVVALTLMLTGLAPSRPHQLELFSQGALAEQEQQFETLLPQLITRYGPTCIYDLILTNPLAHLPEQRFQLQAIAER